MTRTAASSRARAKSTRSSSLSDSAAVLWTWVVGIGDFQAFVALDAATGKRFPGCGVVRQSQIQNQKASSVELPGSGTTRPKVVVNGRTLSPFDTLVDR